LQAYASGVTGRVGNLTYAVQGNILTGACVISAAEAAIRTSARDIPQRLMDALQAAKVGGGDGRCSCSSSAPTRCGCPPPSFTKSGHVGFILSARANDTDDPRYPAHPPTHAHSDTERRVVTHAHRHDDRAGPQSS
jgi:hypothetical protein